MRVSETTFVGADIKLSQFQPLCRHGREPDKSRPSLRPYRGCGLKDWLKESSAQWLNDWSAPTCALRRRRKRNAAWPRSVRTPHLGLAHRPRAQARTHTPPRVVHSGAGRGRTLPTMAACITPPDATPASAAGAHRTASRAASPAGTRAAYDRASEVLAPHRRRTPQK